MPGVPEGGKTRGTSRSQTLSRGIHALEVLAASHRSLTIDEVAGRLAVHRSIAYRIVRTLEDHHLVARDPSGRFAPSAGLAVLAQGVSRDLRDSALPELAHVAEELAMTCFVVVGERRECVTLAAVEPRRAVAAVAHHPGTRHPLDRGAPGIALLTALAAGGRDQPVRERVESARRRGYAISHDEVLAGLSAVAVAIPTVSGPAAAVAVVYVTTDRGTDEIASRLRAAATVIGSRLA